MTRSEFLEKLRSALGNDLSGSVIQENVDYYNNYIQEEVNKGRSEAEVIEELGDPWVIARTIIDSIEGQKEVKSQRQTYDSGYEGYGQDTGDYGNNVHVFRMEGWKKVLLILGVIGVLILIVAVIGGIISLLAPIIIPALLIIVLIQILSNRR